MTHLYALHSYAQSLSHAGQALHVPHWDCSVLMRNINAHRSDAMGTYPLAIMPPEADIAGGLAHLRDHGLVSVVLVLDDVHRPSLESLQQHFTLVRPFKTHYLYRPDGDEPHYDAHHRYELKQALKHLRTGPLDWPRDFSAWVRLYSMLISRRNLSGVHDFPETHHRFLSESENIVGIGAWNDKDELVSAHLWTVNRNKVHSHLAASSEEGYRTRAAYAVNDASLRFFKNAAHINLGGGAGFGDRPDDGLAAFKRGFSNAVASSYIVGAVLDKDAYTELSTHQEASDFFPAYRTPKK